MFQAEDYAKDVDLLKEQSRRYKMSKIDKEALKVIATDRIVTKTLDGIINNLELSINVYERRNCDYHAKRFIRAVFDNNEAKVTEFVAYYTQQKQELYGGK